MVRSETGDQITSKETAWKLKQFLILFVSAFKEDTELSVSGMRGQTSTSKVWHRYTVVVLHQGDATVCSFSQPQDLY